MSTTWVFLGLLAGREIAFMRAMKRESLFGPSDFDPLANGDTKEPYRTTLHLVFKDIFRASVGLLISLIIVVFLI